MTFNTPRGHQGVPWVPLGGIDCLGPSPKSRQPNGSRERE